MKAQITPGPQKAQITPGPQKAQKAQTSMTRSVILIAVLATACSEEAPSDRLRVSGHVEATETRLAPEVGGRILTLPVKEGDRVQPGQTVLTLDTRDVQLAIDRAKAERAAAEAQLRLVQAGARVEDVRQAQ